MIVRQAAILVGGKGTRLGELTNSCPKPLLSIKDDCRFLDYLIDNVARQGFTDIRLLAGHLGKEIEERYGSSKNVYDARIQVHCEAAPRGTAGALIEVKAELDPEFLLMNGDAFVDINLRSFERNASELLMPAVIASLTVDDASRYGTLVTSGSRINSFLEKNAAASGAAVINAGIYRLSKDILERIEDLPSSMETDIFPKLAAKACLAHVPVAGWFLDIGLPETLALARAEMPSRMERPCAIFDRDNTLIVDRGYAHKIEDLQWTEGAEDAIRRLNDAGWRVVVCTNQAGVARGYYDEGAVVAFHAAMNAELAKKGAFVDAFYYCPYHPDALVERYRADHEDRKPKPGMILRAMHDLNMDVRRTFLIGDRESDVLAASAAGIRGYLYQSGSLDRLVASLMSSQESRAGER